MRFKSEEELAKWIAQGRTESVVGLSQVKPLPQPVDPNVHRRILGVDTALRTTGWGIIDIQGGRMRAVDCGVIKNSAKVKVSECLRCLAGGIRELAQLYKPDVAILEGAFFFKNVRTALMLGSARGAVMSVLAEADVTMYEYAPRRVKQSVCGFGNASKEQVALIVSQLLNIKTDQFALDSTDALAMAICHAQDLTTAQGLGIPDEL